MRDVGKEGNYDYMISHQDFLIRIIENVSVNSRDLNDKDDNGSKPLSDKINGKKCRFSRFKSVEL